MKTTLDLSSGSCITGGHSPGFGPRPGFTNRFLESVVLAPDFSGIKEIEMHIRAVDRSCLCPLTLGDSAWRHLVHGSRGVEACQDRRRIAYRRADLCLRTLLFVFPDYFEPEDLTSAARLLMRDCMNGQPIDSDAGRFAETRSRYAQAGHMDPLKSASYWSFEMQAVRRDGFASRFVEVFYALLPEPIPAS